jgi:hypothetical protein
VTGGIPRYLEEIIPERSAEENISRMCFSPSGILFREFNSIFNDTFSKQAHLYRSIVESLVDGKKTYLEICTHLGYEKSGKVSALLEDLSSAGFIRRDYKYSLKTGKKSKLSYFRLKDNYLRFYLKYIFPRTESLIDGVISPQSVTNGLGWSSMIGLQFENLVLNNLPTLLAKMGIDGQEILNASPYFQNETKRERALQVDLLIMCPHTVYLCEIKFKKMIGKTVIEELKTKMKNLNVAKTVSVRPVLIYAGELESTVTESDFFDQIISFEDLLRDDV